MFVLLYSENTILFLVIFLSLMVESGLTKSNTLIFQHVLRKDAFIQQGQYSSCTAINLWLYKSDSGLLNSSVCACLSFHVPLFITCIVNLLL